MKYNNKRISSIRKTHGGKFYLCRRIIEKLEYRPIYVEGFAGGISVYLNIDEKFDKVYIFDRDPDIINVWQSLQKNGDSIRRFLLNTSYDEENFKQACKFVNDHKDEPDDYWYPIHLIIKNRFSRGGLGRDFAWSNRLRGGRPGDENGWINNIYKQLPTVLEKIRCVNFECGDFVDLTIKNGLKDDKDVIFYNDPPYVKNSRVSQNAYGDYEMNTYMRDWDESCSHEELIYFLKYGIKGKAYLSGYNSPQYNEWLVGYNKWEWRIANSSSQKSKKPVKTEVLWRIG